MTVNVVTVIRLAAKELSCYVRKEESSRTGNHKLRNWIGFWILGLSNHFAFFLMLAAAHDLLTRPDLDSEEQFCNPLSTGAIALADTVPALIGIVIAPFCFKNMTLRIWLTIVFNAASFNVAAFSTSNMTVFAGVAFGAFACGFGEASLLAYTTQFDKEIISGFCSGTGAATVVSAAIYLLLSLVLPTKPILLIMNIVPFLTAVAYFFILVQPEPEVLNQVISAPATDEVAVSYERTSFFAAAKSYLIILRHGLWFAIPISISTFSLYFINQGLFELLFFKGTSFDQPMQYRLFSTLSAVGVFLSRSSVQVIRIDKLWTIPMLQLCVLVVVMTHVLEPFLHSIYVVMVLVFLGGIFGGAGYVNTFNKINNVCDEKEKHVISAMSLIGNELAAAVAGFVAIPAHDAICTLILGNNMRS